MNNKQIIVCIFIIIISIILLIFTFLLFYFKSKNKNRKALINFKNDFNIEFLIVVDKTINEINYVENRINNLKYYEEKIKFIYDQLDDIFLKTNQKIVHLLSEYKTIEKNTFVREIKWLEENKQNVDKIKKEFQFIKNNIVQQKNFLDHDFTFYRSIMRDVDYNFKINYGNMQMITKQINEFIKKIKELEKQFELTLLNKNTEQSYKLLNKYVSKVKKMIDIVSHAKSFEMMLLNTLPNKIKEIDNKIDNIQTKYNLSFSHLNYDEWRKKIIRIKFEAIYEFKNFNTKIVEKKIKIILKEIKKINYFIDLEFNCFFEFENKKNIYKKLIKRSIDQFKQVDYTVKSNAHNVKNIKLVNLHENTKKEFKNFMDIYIQYEKINNRKTSYHKKLLTIKKILISLVELENKLNLLLNNFSILSNKNEQYPNQLKQIISAMEDIKYLIKEYNIFSTGNDVQLQNSIKNKIKIITTSINDKDFDNKFKEEISFLIKEITLYYKKINNKIHMIAIIKELIVKLNKDRIFNPTFNAKIESAQKNYISGKYDISLEMLLNVLEERGK